MVNNSAQTIEYNFLLENGNNKSVIAFNSIIGQSYFNASSYKTSFFDLAPNYIPQQHITTCGIASAVILLNTIYRGNSKKCPLAINNSWTIEDANTIYGYFRWTEDNFFTPEITKIFDKDIIRGNKKWDGKYCPGLTLAELSKALNIHALDCSSHYVTIVTDKYITDFRTLVKSVCKNSKAFIIVNYHLSLQFTNLDSGHFSPLAAYDENSDRVLILDTWASSSTWIWVKLTDLYKSMNTMDDNSYRGYMIVDTNIN